MSSRSNGAGDPVTSYARAIVRARTGTVGTHHRLACERHLADLGTARRRGLHWSPEHAQYAIGFFNILRHWKGEWAGQPVTLEPWQQFIVGGLMGWRRDDGTRRFRNSYIEIPRKNGKSTLAAGIGLLLGFFDQEAGAEVYCAATRRKQAAIVFECARRFVLTTPALARRIRVQRHNLSHDGSASLLEAIASDSTRLDGLNASVALVDELHAHPNAEIVDVLETSMGSRRQPLHFEITTAGTSTESICWKHHAYSVGVLESTFTDDAWFAFIAAADKKDDWQDPQVWRKANPNFGVSVKAEYLAEKARKAANMPAAVNPFLTKHLDVWVEQSERFFDMRQWDACAELGGVDEAGFRAGVGIYAGLDLAATRDMASLVSARRDDDEIIEMIPRFWIPAIALKRRERVVQVSYQQWIDAGLLHVTPGDMLDYARIRTDVLNDAEAFKISEVGYDPWNAAQLAGELQAAGLTMIPIRPGFAAFHDPTSALGELVTAGKVRHGRHPILTWMASNMVVTRDADGRIKPDRKRAADKIDGMVALIMALDRLNRNTGTSAYEDGDVMVVGDDAGQPGRDFSGEELDEWN